MSDASLKVLYASFCYVPSLGGGEVHLHTVARALKARGHEPRVVYQQAGPVRDWLQDATWNATSPRAHRQDGIDVRRLGFSLPRRLAMLPLTKVYRRAPRLADRASRGISALWRADFARLGGEPDLVHSLRIGQEFLARAAFDFSRRRDRPFVLTRMFHPPTRNPLHRAYDELARRADAVVALSPWERDLLVETRGVAPERVHVLGIGPVLAERHDVEAFRARYGIDGPYVLFLGRHLPHKGYRALLEAAPALWRRHPELRFVFVGPSGHGAEQAFAERTDPRIHRLGPVDEVTKTSALAGCELLCVPSSAESFGGVYVEAWSFAKPIVAGRIGSVASIVEDGTTGLLASQDPAEITERIGWLLDHPARARELGAAGRAELERRYTWKQIFDRTEALYRSLV